MGAIEVVADNMTCKTPRGKCVELEVGRKNPRFGPALKVWGNLF